MKLKNKVINNIKIEGLAAEGNCFTKYDGQVIFVKNVAPGDICDLKITKRKRKFLHAIAINIHEYGKGRSTPFCTHYGTCGGCKWQHIDYELQVESKHQQVIDNFTRIGKIDIGQIHPIMPSESKRYYRNKLEYTFSDARWLTHEEISSEEDLDRQGLGFHIPERFDKILDIDHCYLQPDPSNNIRLAIKDFAKENSLSFFNLVHQTGLLRNLIIRTASSGQVMVILQVTAEDKKAIQSCMERLSQFEEITSLNYVVNNKGNDTYHNLDVICVKGKPYIEEYMTLPNGQNITYRVGPKSFYQTNAQQAERLYHKAWEMASITTDDLVYDLYTGTGTIANYIAADAKHVIGIEYVTAAIEDAKVNSHINNIKNTSFFAGDMRDMLKEAFINNHGHPDIIITDPPRAGMHPDVCKVLLQTSASKIVYISCNPATQARDIGLLSDKYKVDEIQTVDMFPHTHHVENIALLSLK